jgi:hypothetical protein
VRFIPEAGDLVGFELELDLDGPKASGEFRDYEGGCGIPARVSGTLERGRLTLRGVNKYNVKIEIAGTISGQNAGVTIHVGEGAPETVKLMLAAKAHCRETSQLPL